MKLKILDLFSGIGGFSLGLESTGHFETAAFCEIEPYCQKVLKKHWPNVPIFDDIRKLKGKDIGAIDIITGGYPCQPFSVAGKQKAEQDPRHLWPEYFRLIKELRPTWIIGENVSGHVKLGLDTVLENLESEGYSSRTFSISASSVGANHQRERIWIVANARQHGGRIESTRNKESIGRGSPKETKWSTHTDKTRGSSERGEALANSSSSRRKVRLSKEGHRKEGHTEKFDNESNRQRGWQREDNWAIEPNVGRVAHGIPNRVDRLKCLGNSLVPQIPYYIGSVILKTMENTYNN